MFERILDCNNLEQSIFLFGARQTGKSTLLKNKFKDAIFFDLLDSDLGNRLRRRPALLYETLKNKAADTLVIIDEIPEIPQLLNEVHRLISEKQLIFILCGSSARKLKRKGQNTLGGRAIPYYLYPLVSAEIPEFNLAKALQDGMIPDHYKAKKPRQRLSAYIDIYLKEEILQKALVRNLSYFERFLEVAALTNGEMVNYNNVATDCGISASTVKEYFSILQDTLIGYMVPAYAKTVKRALIQAPRFYFFDVGVVNHLLHRNDLLPGTPEYGHAFEHFVILEIIAFLSYHRKEERLSYWRTYNGAEVDAIIGDKLAVEIKSADEALPKHLKGLKAFGEEHPECRRILVSADRFNRKMGDIECLYILDFLHALWRGELV